MRYFRRRNARMILSFSLVRTAGATPFVPALRAASFCFSSISRASSSARASGMSCPRRGRTSFLPSDIPDRIRTVFSSRALSWRAAVRSSSRTSALVIVVEEDLLVITRSPLRVVAVSICTLPPAPGRSNFSTEWRLYARTETRDSEQINLLAQMCAPIWKDPAFSQHWRGSHLHGKACMPPDPARPGSALRSGFFFVVVRLFGRGRSSGSRRGLPQEAQRILDRMGHARLGLVLRRLQPWILPHARSHEHGMEIQLRRGTVSVPRDLEVASQIAAERHRRLRIDDQRARHADRLLLLPELEPPRRVRIDLALRILHRRQIALVGLAVASAEPGDRVPRHAPPLARRLARAPQLQPVGEPIESGEPGQRLLADARRIDRKSTRLNSSH